MVYADAEVCYNSCKTDVSPNVQNPGKIYPRNHCANLIQSFFKYQFDILD